MLRILSCTKCIQIGHIFAHLHILHIWTLLHTCIFFYIYTLFTLAHTLTHLNIQHFLTYFTHFCTQSCKLTHFCTLAHLHTFYTCAHFCTPPHTLAHLHIKHFCTHFFTNFRKQSYTVLHTFEHLPTQNFCTHFFTILQTFILFFCTLHINLHTCKLLTLAHNYARFHTLF